MQINDLPKPNSSWPSSAQSAYTQLMVWIMQQNEQLSMQSEQLSVQSEQLTLQAQKITHLEERLKLNSRNSNKPSSSDQKPPPRKRKESSRKRGGQEGHEGSSRNLEEPTEIIVKQPKKPRCDCGGVWCAEGEVERFQVTELPKVKPVVTEYQLRRYRCRSCGVKCSPGYQPELGYSRFGPRLHAFVTELSVVYRLSVRQIKSQLKQSFGITTSIGAIEGMLKRCASVSAAQFRTLHTWFKADKNMKHVDETGWKIGGKSASLIGAMNHFASLFSVSKHRKRDDIINLIGAELNRVIISDRALVYNAWANRQLCWSHLLRDFTFISEASGGRQKGNKLVRRARQLFQFNRNFKAGKLSSQSYLQQAKQLRAEIYETLIELKMKPKLSWIAAGKVRCLLIQEEQLWTFLNDPTLPIHNNAQERELRNPVIKRKLSYGSDTLAGGQRYAQLLSVIRTLERQGKRWCDWFVRLCAGDVESLIPTQD